MKDYCIRNHFTFELPATEVFGSNEYSVLKSLLFSAVANKYDGILLSSSALIVSFPFAANLLADKAIGSLKIVCALERTCQTFLEISQFMCTQLLIKQAQSISLAQSRLLLLDINSGK